MNYYLDGSALPSKLFKVNSKVTNITSLLFWGSEGASQLGDEEVCGFIHLYPLSDVHERVSLLSHATSLLYYT